jgi:uncharacterized membrane-anchored protein YhcB (DUF1043 family)
MNNCQEWFYLCCGFLGVILGLFAMTLNYNLKMSANQKEMKAKLEKQSKELSEVERVNGKEKRDIAELQAKVKELEKKSPK